MNEYISEKSSCFFHPKEVIVGVCSLCLTERLLILASKQGHHHHHHHHHNHHLSQADDDHQEHHSFRTNRAANHRRLPSFTLPKIFALGSLLNRFDPLHNHHFHNSDTSASTSPEEDSFISMKFEDNGLVSWEKNMVSKVLSLDQNNNNISWNHSLSKDKENKEDKSLVVEHTKPRGSLRWRKRIGHLFQLTRWKKSSKASVCHVGNKLEGLKVRGGWIRSLTKRKSKE